MTTTAKRGRRMDTTLGAECGCAVRDASTDSRKALAVDPEVKSRNLKRLRRIEGQVRGLQKMVEDDRYCADILTQISSVHEALRGVGRELMRNHLKHCAVAKVSSHCNLFSCNTLHERPDRVKRR